MKFFKNTSFLFKLILTLCIVFMFGIVFNSNNIVHAEIEQSEAAQGGKLLTPIVDLISTIGDALMDILQRAVMGTDGHVAIDIASKKSWIKIVGFALAILVFVVISVVTAGLADVIAGLGGAAAAVIGLLSSSAIVSTVFTAAALGISGLTYVAVVGIAAGNLPDVTVFPTFSLSPEAIFEGKLLTFDIDFFEPKTLYVKLKSGNPKIAEQYNSESDGEIDYYFYYDGTKEVKTSKQNTAASLSRTISKWYYSIRNLAIIIMMLILVYIGIRIMLCSIASEKSKYKKMLADWVVSMCLVFVLQYIMIFAVNINEEIVKIISKSIDSNQTAVILSISEDNMDKKKRKNFINGVKEEKELVTYLRDENNEQVYDEDGNKIGGEPTTFRWLTNSVGKMRMLSQVQNGSSEYVGYAIAYLVMVFYTVFFAFTYIKRVLYMAFLTIMAPLVAMTYSVDKIADGKAQAFNMWLKEYIFNLLIQPVHLLLYMVLISMSFELASENIIYTLVAIGFMMPAEKLIRQMFGFEKAKTPGFLGGATGAALTMSALKGINRFVGKSPSKVLQGGGEKNPRLAQNSNTENAENERAAESGNDMISLLNRGSLNTNGSEDDQQSTMDNSDNTTTQNLYDGSSGGGQIAGVTPVMNNENNNDGDGNTETDTSNIHFANSNIGSSSPEDIVEQLNRAHPRSWRQKIINSGIYAGKKGLAKKKFKSGARAGVVPSLQKTKKVLNLGGTLVGGAVGTGIGAALGIASGDPKSAIQDIGLGASVGTQLGTGVSDRITSGMIDGGIKGTNKAKEQYEKDKKQRYGEDYQKMKNAEEDLKFKKSNEKRNFYEDKFKEQLNGLTEENREKKIDEIMNDVIKYRRAGVTNDDVIVNAMKLNANGATSNDRTSNDSILAAQMFTKGKDLNGIEKYEKQLGKRFGEERIAGIADNARKIGGIYK